MIEDFVERAEREEKHQTNPGDEIEKLIVAGHCAFHCRVDAKVLLLLLISRRAWPFGSRTIRAFLNPSFA